MSDKKTQTTYLWARIDNERVAELLTYNPTGHFHEDIIWARVPDFLAPYVNADYVYRDVTGDDIPEIVPPSLEYLADQMREEIKVRRDTMQNFGIVVDGVWFKSTRESMADIKNFIVDCDIVAKFEDKPHKAQWKAKDGNFVEMTKELAEKVAYEGILHINWCFRREAEIIDTVKKAAVKKGASLEGVLKLFTSEMSKGWPIESDGGEFDYTAGQNIAPSVAITGEHSAVDYAPDEHSEGAEDYSEVINYDELLDSQSAFNGTEAPRAEILLGDFADAAQVGAALYAVGEAAAPSEDVLFESVKNAAKGAEE